MLARWVPIAGVLLLPSATPAQTPQTAAYETLGTTRHFTFLLRPGAAAPDDMQAAMHRAEELFAAVSRYVGAGHTPSRRIEVRFEGPALDADGRWHAPNVDWQGRIHLYRFGNPEDDYLSHLAHELVHAFRRATGERFDGFLEEGFASVVGLATDPTAARGFPLYGYDLTVAAGHLVAGDEYIPLATLRRDHAQLNLRCQLQSYVPRLAFFTYLADTFGRDAMLELAYGDLRWSDPYRRVFAVAFEELVRRWREDLLDRYRALPNADAQARAYRASRIRHKPVCRAGVHF